MPPKKRTSFHQTAANKKRKKLLQSEATEEKNSPTVEVEKGENSKVTTEKIAERREKNRLRTSASRASENEEQTKKRRESNLHSTRAARACEDGEQTKKRRESDLHSTRAARACEDGEHTKKRRESDLHSTRAARACEDEEKTKKRRESDLRSTRAARAREEEKNLIKRKESNLHRVRTSRIEKWLSLKGEAFKYDPEVKYHNFPLISIGTMSKKCCFCDALKFEGETLGLCCSGGKVALPDLPELPEPLKNLMNENHPLYKEFLRQIRKYNCSFQMTSFGTSVPLPQSTGFMPTFKIQGQVYHKAGSLLPLPEEEPKFLQIYFLGDSEAETERRCEVIKGTNKDIINSLQKMLHENNFYVRKFKMALDENPSEDLKIVIKADKRPSGEHERVYNAPVVNEVAIIIAGNDFEKRDIVLTTRSNQLQKISETHISYDALQYPLMFPHGEDGYAININQVIPGTSKTTTKMVTAMSFYAYRLMVRSKENHLLNFRQLLHQYLVDMFAKIETERLLFLRLNQQQLRVDEYIHLKDAIVNDGNAENHGKLVILPSTHTGGPRNMHEYTQDAITYVRHGGKPSLFITYTFNPKCKEMEENLIKGQSRTDRHDLVARIFRQKLIKFMNILTKAEIFGAVKFWLYSVEWQKRGLPHAHILIWLEKGLKMDKIDDIISAEIPDPNIDKELYDIVAKNMVHGPCGAFNFQSPCMKEKMCTKKFPRQFINESQTLTDGYPLYRRRSPEDGGHTATVILKSKEVKIDNRWIVPYSPLLLKMFDAHINVECCNSVKSIKYILKYVHKGSDQGVFTTKREEGEIDEISEYQAGRYISSNEAAWRIFGFPIHERHPAVVHLDVHLENGQRIYFNKDNLKSKISSPPNTTLTAFFKLCGSDDFAKTILYCDVPKYFTWDKSKKVFNRRKQGVPVDGYDGILSGDALGRVYTVHVKNFDCYYMRMLLHKITGPTCFEDLKTIDGIQHETYHAACLALGLLENDNQWEETLTEAEESTSPSKIRNLFAMILSYCKPSNPTALWENHKNGMSEDILNSHRRDNPLLTLDYSEDVYNEALVIIEDKVLEMISTPLSEIGMKKPLRRQASSSGREMLREMSHDYKRMEEYVLQNEPLLNQEQRGIYDEVLRRHGTNEGGVIFIDAPGGTGKTFLINLLLARIRGGKNIALAVASSGIAATLMSGGRTAHSMLQIPIDLIHNDAPVCNIKKGTEKAKVIIEAKALFWDEISMMHKHGFEAVDRTLKDIRGNPNFMGGLMVVLAGDFRQTLPVIPRGTMADEIKACLKSSKLWKLITVMKLTTNMRVQRCNQKHQTFSEYLLRIGDGKEEQTQTCKIKLSKDFCTVCDSLKSLIDCVYPNIRTNVNRKWLQERAILTPLNVKVEEINKSMLERLPGSSRTYLSIDKCVNEEEATSYPVEFLNSLNPNGIPPHKLDLKVGSPIMLLRNMDPPKLCNGSRLTVKVMHAHVIDAEILTGPFEGERVFIPRIPLIPTDLPFSFQRLQFPVRLAFAFTINKSQGQSLKVTGIDLTDECFSHGQLYVGMSRATDPQKLYIVADKQTETKNVVYSQVLTA